MNFTRQNQSSGFALVVAIALMAFVLLLIVALSSLIQVETQRAKAELDQFEARQNALLGLRLAIAHLQSDAGVDRVATARAETIGVVSDAVDEDGDGSTEVIVHPSKRYWTGVFPGDLSIPHDGLRELGSWLVSGNPIGREGVGRAEPDAARLLRFIDSDNLSEVVVEAPREKIVRGAGGDIGGHFAYWIADESMKAKINLVNPLAELDPADGDSYWQFASAQRFGAERINGLQGLGALYDRSDDSAFNPHLMDRIGFITDLPLAGLTDEDLDLGNRSFDLTTQSWGVLSDARFGGLKRDLTTHFERPSAFRSYEFIVPEDVEDWIADGSRTNPNQLGVLFRHARGPSWSLLQDYAHLYRDLGPTGDSLAPRLGIGGGPPQSGSSMANFPETMTIAPVLLYQGLGFGFRLAEIADMFEEVAITALDRDDLGGLAVSDENGGIPNATVQSRSDIELFARNFFRIHFTIEPVIALWNPYDVRLEVHDYLVEFSFSNGLWGAQPAMYMRNTAISDWLHMHSISDSSTTTLVFNDALNRWYVFPDERGEGFNDYSSHFSIHEMDFLGEDHRLETWNFHLTEVLPDFADDYQSYMEFDIFGRHQSPYNAYFSSGANASGAKIHNLHFAMQSVTLEPGEIKWFSLRGRDLDYSPENRILEQGFHGGNISLPIRDTVGWRSRSHPNPVNEEDINAEGQTYRYLPSSYKSNSFDSRGTWLDINGAERPWVDIGLVVIDTPVGGTSSLDHMGSEGIELGLGHRSGQYAINLRMLDPVLAATGGDLTDHLNEPFGPGSASGPENHTWRALRYVNVGPGGNSGIHLSTVAAPVGWRRDLLSTGVYMMSPNRDEINYRADNHNTGVKILSAQNVISRYHGWNSYRDTSQASTGGERFGYGTSSPTYGFTLETAPTYAFDQYQLWHDAAIVRAAADDPEYRAVLFYLPRDELFSIGQFQHLPISRTQWDPTYVLGNSFASPWIPPDDTWIYTVRTTHPDPLAANFTLHDRSYIINSALLDSTFFSTWRPTEDPRPKNPRLTVADPIFSGEDAPDADSMAARLMVNGPFNVNSTSVEAWKAVLGSMNQQALRFRDVGGEGGVYPEIELEGLRNPFLRSPRPSGGAAQQPSGGSFPDDDSAYWRGFREIDDAQVDELAEAIVAEIRNRGPFRTISEFVNRRLGPPSSAEALRGAVQAAIDTQSRDSDNPINPPVFFGNVEPGGGSVINDGNYAFAEAALGARHEGAPGFLMQADVLSPLFPILTTRGDTFVIRSYGDVITPGSDGITSRVWCEAVVQRMPEYLDPIDRPEVAPSELASDLNSRFGRRYVILSIRWLRDDEI